MAGISFSKMVPEREFSGCSFESRKFGGIIHEVIRDTHRRWIRQRYVGPVTPDDFDGLELALRGVGLGHRLKDARWALAGLCKLDGGVFDWRWFRFPLPDGQKGVEGEVEERSRCSGRTYKALWDRVDVRNGAFRVVDYKTGIPREVAKVQVRMYSAVAYEHFSRLNGGDVVVVGQLWHLFGPRVIGVCSIDSPEEAAKIWDSVECQGVRALEERRRKKRPRRRRRKRLDDPAIRKQSEEWRARKAYLASLGRGVGGQRRGQKGQGQERAISGRKEKVLVSGLSMWVRAERHRKGLK